MASHGELINGERGTRQAGAIDDVAARTRSVDRLGFHQRNFSRPDGNLEGGNTSAGSREREQMAAEQMNRRITALRRTDR